MTSTTPLSDRSPSSPWLQRYSERDVASRWCATSAEGAVASAHYLATAAGAETLGAGGNAIDAAVATGLALGVCEPAGSGLGGMAMMIVHLAESRRTFVVEAPCRAPRRATPGAVADSHRYRGHRAVAVPTAVAAYHHVLRTYGRLSEATVAAPAIRLARDGFPVPPVLWRVATRYVKTLRKHRAGDVFLDAGAPPPVGTMLKQPTLAQTLERLAQAGFDDFYEGEIATRLCADMRAHDGFVAEDDLGEPLVREGEPLTGRFGAHTVHTMGSPGGGTPLLQMLHMADVARRPLDLRTADGTIAAARIIRRARRDRRRHRLDPAHGASTLTTPTYARARAKQLGIVGSEDDGSDGETTHVSVADRWGNVVAMTQSIERSFGAAAFAPELGFLYNGYLRAFKVQNRRHPHFLTPGSAARSNAAPTLVLDDGRPVAAVGSTGSERMASGIFEVLLRLEHEAPFEAVHAPRLHCTPEGKVLLEGPRFDPAVLVALGRAGFAVESYDAYAFEVGGLQLLTSDGREFAGVADPRRDGAASAPLSSPAG